MITEKDFFERLSFVLERPGMFGIQKIEDVFLIFSAEIFIHRNEWVEKWNQRFNEFVIGEINETLTNFDWSKVIRLYSGSDYSSIELFKQLYSRFTEAE
ncbi:MAG: hypothetical protein ACTHMV_10370 [Chitinophagaceae bacterium]